MLPCRTEIRLRTLPTLCAGHRTPRRPQPPTAAQELPAPGGEQGPAVLPHGVAALCTGGMEGACRIGNALQVLKPLPSLATLHPLDRLRTTRWAARLRHSCCMRCAPPTGFPPTCTPSLLRWWCMMALLRGRRRRSRRSSRTAGSSSRARSRQRLTSSSRTGSSSSRSSSGLLPRASCRWTSACRVAASCRSVGLLLGWLPSKFLRN